MLTSYANNLRVFLDFILALGSIVIALISLLGALWFFGSFGKCAQVILILAPISLLVATGSVFIGKLSGQLLALFAIAIACGLILFAVIAVGGVGLCAEQIDVKIGAWPFAALFLLAARIALLNTSGSNDS